jgi:hypothetical protein
MTDAELHREEWIEERAGILEHDAGYPRIVAEALAKAMWSDYSRAQARAGSLS